MRWKRVLAPIVRPRIFFTRTFATASYSSSQLTITNPFNDDAGNPCQAYPNDPSHAADNDKAFNSALNSVNYTDITIPAGRYYFSAPILMSNLDSQGNPLALPKKIISGNANTIPLNFPNVGYPLSIDCASTILDFSRSSINDTLITISGHGVVRRTVAGPCGPLTQKLTDVSNAGLRRGDILFITDPNEASYGPRKYYHRGEFFKVTNIPTGIPNEIHIEPSIGNYEDLEHPPRNPVPALYLFGKINPIEIEFNNITIVDDSIKNVRSWPTPTTTTPNPDPRMNGAFYALKLKQCKNSSLNNVFIVDASYNTALTIQNCVDVKINSGKYILGVPDHTRNINQCTQPSRHVTSGYTYYLPSDGYGIGIADSQDVRINGVDARSWRHAITSGGGGGNGVSDIFWIVNRNLNIMNSQLTNTPPTIDFYDNGQMNPAYQAKAKCASANFHGNTENSSYVHNTLHGAGFNIGGHNITIENNTIHTDNENEPLGTPDIHYDSAFYFDEAKSGRFKISNNKVYIRKFYQNKAMEDRQISDGEELRFGEFVHFNLGGLFRFEGSWLISGVTYSGTLEITNNCVRIDCGGEDINNNYTTGLITIGGVDIDSNLAQLITNNPKASTALNNTQVDVKISKNIFSIFNNPRNPNNIPPTKSTALVAVNPLRTKNTSHERWTRIKSIEMIDNNFCGLFKFSLNKSGIFNQASSDLVKIRDNKFWSDLTEAEIKNNIGHTTQSDVANNQTDPYTGSCTEIGQCVRKN